MSKTERKIKLPPKQKGENRNLKLHLNTTFSEAIQVLVGNKKPDKGIVVIKGMEK